jgi:pimeloyl-ACP methyl ester carboxylesterase
MDDRPVLLVHGLASSFDHNWRATGWVDLLADEGRAVLAMDLPGHGTNAAADPAAVSPGAAVLAALGDRSGVDAVGFSAGGHALLSAAATVPARFRRIAVLGIGDLNGRGAASSLIDGLESGTEPADPHPRVIRRLAASAGNDRRNVAAYLRARHPGVTLAGLAAVELPVLVVLGDRDPVGPADGLLSALPDARLVTLPGVDHFATPSDVRCIEAVTRFLAG